MAENTEGNHSSKMLLHPFSSPGIMTLKLPRRRLLMLLMVWGLTQGECREAGREQGPEGIKKGLSGLRSCWAESEELGRGGLGRQGSVS